MWKEEPGIPLMPAGAEFPLYHCHRVPAFHKRITRIFRFLTPVLPSKFSHIFLHGDSQLTQHLPVVLQLPLPAELEGFKLSLSVPWSSGCGCQETPLSRAAASYPRRKLAELLVL